MNKEKENIKQLLQANKNQAALCLNNFITEDEKLIAVYEFLDQKRRISPRNFTTESDIHVLTNKRLIHMEIREEELIFSYHPLDNIYSFSVVRENAFPRELSNLKEADFIKVINIILKDKINSEKILSLKIKDSSILSLTIQKEAAYMFIKKLNLLLNRKG